MKTNTWTDRVAILAGSLAVASMLLGATGALAAYGQWVGRPCGQCRSECMYFVQQCMRLPQAQRPPGCAAIGGDPNTYCDGWCAGCTYDPPLIQDCSAAQCRFPESAPGPYNHICSNACNNNACGSYEAQTRCLTLQNEAVGCIPTTNCSYCGCATPP